MTCQRTCCGSSRGCVDGFLGGCIVEGVDGRVDVAAGGRVDDAAEETVGRFEIVASEPIKDSVKGEISMSVERTLMKRHEKQ